MTSQYDSIGARYNTIKQLPIAIVERENVKDAVLPYLGNLDSPRALDLACGTGLYSQNLLQWGAAYVHGVDLSTSMVEVAKQTITAEQQQKAVLKFDVGNAVTLGKIKDEEPFDLVTGSWLLNYSGDLEEMTQMFRSISDNLKPGGVFVGVTPHPTEDVDAYAGMANDVFQEHLEMWCVGVKYFEKLASGEGWRTEVVGHGDPPVSFTNFHLKRSVYEEAARRGGMTGKLTWKDVEVPQEALEKTKESPGYWHMYNEFCLGVLIVEK